MRFCLSPSFPLRWKLPLLKLCCWFILTLVETSFLDHMSSILMTFVKILESIIFSSISYYTRSSKSLELSSATILGGLFVSIRIISRLSDPNSLEFSILNIIRTLEHTQIEHSICSNANWNYVLQMTRWPR